eukprot:NODE_1337_length_1001_cov_46.539916_g1030_i0.p1 GENE.NODE_1337_length_1001_cov_46.539916_g1030_i0~~NODE_1337_length_1001_cov_46.539916_g1030_i0.p1  ORF type:complete len:247 (-),score=68.67 NODE_1337_length_1001_cov_46.539916_g1030_i0:261-938(-)
MELNPTQQLFVQALKTRAASNKLVIGLAVATGLTGLAAGAWHYRADLTQEKMFHYAVDTTFTKFDVNGDGVIDSTELYLAVIMLYQELNKAAGVTYRTPSPVQVKSLFQHSDLDQSGSLDKAEFVRFAHLLATSMAMDTCTTTLRQTLFIPYAATLAKQALRQAPFLPGEWLCELLPTAAFYPACATIINALLSVPVLRKWRQHVLLYIGELLNSLTAKRLGTQG